jgi:hypothetical protein
MAYRFDGRLPGKTPARMSGSFSGILGLSLSMNGIFSASFTGLKNSALWEEWETSKDSLSSRT